MGLYTMEIKFLVKYKTISARIQGEEISHSVRVQRSVWWWKGGFGTPPGCLHTHSDFLILRWGALPEVASRPGPGGWLAEQCLARWLWVAEESSSDWVILAPRSSEVSLWDLNACAVGATVSPSPAEEVVSLTSWCGCCSSPDTLAGRTLLLSPLGTTCSSCLSSWST